MQAINTAAATKKARLAAVKRTYAPRPKPAVQPHVRHDSPEEAQLRRITASTLEALKNPSAIPSNVIMDALRKARALNGKG